MSTATYERPPLYAVPTPPEQKARLGLLLTLRRRARQALDTLLALPRGAAGWVLRHLRAALDELGQHRLLDMATALLHGGAPLVRGIGAVPLLAGVLSTPPVWRTVVRWARAAGSGLFSLAGRAWARTKSLLTRSGTNGARLAQALSRAGLVAVQTACSVAAYPAAQLLVRTGLSLAGAVRPVSRAVVLHRVLGMLVPVAWIRVAVEAVAMTFVLAPEAAQMVRGTETGSAAAPVPEVQLAAVVPKAAGTSAPMEDDVPEDPVVEPRNRAERRAQQQEQARARRSHTRR